MARKPSEIEKSEKPLIWFKLTYSLKSMFANRDLEEPVVVALPDDCEIKFWMRTFPPEKRIQPELCCSAIKRRTVNSKVYAHFQNLFNRVLPRDSSSTVKLPYRLSSEAEIDADGNLPNWGLNLDIFPSNFQYIHSEIHTELADVVKSYVTTLRWVQKASGKQAPFGHVSFDWSFDRQNWSPMPANFTVSVEQHRGMELESLDKVTNLWMEQQFEPLAHELLREALDVLMVNPRSALLITSTALETGLKQYIGFLLPNSSVLLDKMPSPSPMTMVRDVIPEIHRLLGKPELSLQQKDLDALQKWNLIRNEVAHGVNRQIDRVKLKEFLVFVQQLLYHLDEQRGESWAQSYSLSSGNDNSE